MLDITLPLYFTSHKVYNTFWHVQLRLQSTEDKLVPATLPSAYNAGPSQLTPAQEALKTIRTPWKAENTACQEEKEI